MVEVEHVLMQDRFLQPHAAYWMREMHILVYKQFLDSYQSVTLQAMANSFGVSTKFIDDHASRFIAAGRLSAKIDKYGVWDRRHLIKTPLFDELYKVNRCLARYSLHATTTNQRGTKLTGKAYKCTRKHILGQIWPFLGQNSYF